MLARVGSDPRIGAVAIVAALALAALVHPLRPVVAAVLLGGYLVARRGGSPYRLGARRGPARGRDPRLGHARPAGRRPDRRAVRAISSRRRPCGGSRRRWSASSCSRILVVDRGSRWSELGFNRASRRGELSSRSRGS